MAKALAAARSGFRRLFSISAFTPPPPVTPPPKADPSTNLFVSGLSKRTTSEGLREAFAKFGEVVHAKVVTDRVSGYSKGFGFVRYASIDEAAEGIKGMDGKFLDGWVIFAEYAKPRPPPSQDQSSQSQMNYGSAPQFNYSSPMSQSSYYTSAATSNYSSQGSSQPPLSSSNYSPQATQPPLSNSYNAPQASQTQQSYGGSAPPSNYESLQAQSGYTSSYFNHSSQTSQTPPSNVPPPPSGYSSSYFNPSNGPVPPFNYSSEISPQQTSNSSTSPSWYSSQNTQPANYLSGPPNYTQSQYGSAPAPNHSSQAPQQTYSFTPQASEPASGYASTQSNTLKSENPMSYAPPRNSETFEPSSSYPSELRPDYEPGRAANY